DIFIPDGQALRLGSYLKMPDLADVLRAGLRNFYHGAISQETEQAVISFNWTCGSRIVTESGILLNSLILNFWPNKRRDQPQSNQKNSMKPLRRPLTFLMPAVMILTWNKCGTYMALSSSGGPHRLSEVTQMLVSLLFLHKDKNDTRSLGGPPPQPSDSEFPEECVAFPCS
ncbi:hypothetical protein GOODEAATRI_024582, partial [Goodea atripinnis]